MVAGEGEDCGVDRAKRWRAGRRALSDVRPWASLTSYLVQPTSIKPILTFHNIELPHHTNHSTSYSNPIPTSAMELESTPFPTLPVHSAAIASPAEAAQPATVPRPTAAEAVEPMVEDQTAVTDAVSKQAVG